MARGNIRAATSLVLIPVLVLQTACMTAVGAPMPIDPGDQAQKAAIERAAQIRVVTVEGTPYRLIRVELTADQLSGRKSKSAARTVIPIDSISTVQAYKANEVLVVLGVMAALGGLLMLDLAASLDQVPIRPSQ